MCFGQGDMAVGAARRLYMCLYFDPKGKSHLACWPALRVFVSHVFVELGLMFSG